MKKIAPLIICLFLIIILCCQRDLTAPESLSFAWPQASPESQGLDSQQLNAAFDEAGKASFVYALVVTRNGYLVGERYYRGTDANDAHTIRSVSKSFLSALYGIALENGHLATLDTPMVDFLPEYANFVQDERMADMTLSHLLTMRGGFDGDSKILFDMIYSDNWLRMALSQNLIFKPGSSYRYSTVGTHLLSVILTKATGRTTRDYADEFLFEPLGISVRDWARDPQGYYFGGNDMYVTPRDMARFGRLYLNNGQLNGRQIVPAAWVDRSTSVTYRYQNGTWGAIDNIAYGYLWWLGEMRDIPLVMALGYGGQFIFNFPTLNMVVTTASFSDFADWDAADAQERAVTEIVANYILPAVRQGNKTVLF